MPKKTTTTSATKKRGTIQPIPMKKSTCPKLLHKMAVRIQQGFWYSNARWATKHRMAMRMIKAGFEYRTTDTRRMELATFIPSVFSPNMQEMLRLWLERVLIVNRNTVQDVKGTVMRLTAAYTLAMYGAQLVPLTLEHTPALMLAAEQLSMFMTLMMQDKAYPSETVTRFVQLLRNFLAVYSIWQSKNKTAVHRLLVQQALLHVHDVLSQRLTALDNKASAMLLLIKKYSIVLCEPIEVIKDTVLCCKEMKLVRTLPNSSLWGPGNLSVFRLMHELLMNEHFDITIETTLPKFSELYSRIPSSPISITTFLADLRAVVMWPIRQDEVLLDMARVLDIENMQWPEDIKGIATQLVPLLCKTIPDNDVNNSIRNEWQSMHPIEGVPNQRILAFLRDAALKMRFVYGKMDLHQCRRNIRRHPNGFHQTAANTLISKATQTKRTELWLQHALETYSYQSLERVARGDPFAIMALHDETILDYALQGDFVSPSPETLVFDVPRLQLIHANVGLIGETEEANARLRKTLRTLVNDDEDVPKYPQHIVKAAEELRKIIFVSRFQHGEMVSSLARDVATRLMEANAMLGISRLSDMATAILK